MQNICINLSNPSNPSNLFNPSNPSNPINLSNPSNPINQSNLSNPINPSNPSNLSIHLSKVKLAENTWAYIHSKGIRKDIPTHLELSWIRGKWLCGEGNRRRGDKVEKMKLGGEERVNLCMTRCARKLLMRRFRWRQNHAKRCGTDNVADETRKYMLVMIVKQRLGQNVPF